MTCNYIVPRYNANITPNREILECVREENHEGLHLSKHPGGYYILWEFAQCDCTEDDCQCFDYAKISAARAERILAGKETGAA